MSLLSFDEVIKYAILIEENGEAFYRYWANRTQNLKRQKFLDFLADEENAHKRIFKRIMNQLKTSDFKPDGIDNQQYEDYLKKVSQKIMFNREKFEEETKEVNDLISAVGFAMQKELDSLIFYVDLKMYVPHEHVEVMNKIIKEEQNHYTKLEKFKEKLLSHKKK